MFKKLKIAHKFAALVSVFALPTLYLLLMLTSETSGEVRIIAREIAGVEYLKALLPVFSELEVHQYDASVPIAIAPGALQALTAQGSSIGIDGAGPSVATALGLMQGRLVGAPHDEKALRSAQQGIVSLISTVGERSGLVVDSVLDSYYLADLSVRVLPHLLDSLADLGSVPGRPFRRDSQLLALGSLDAARIELREGLTRSVSNNAEGTIATVLGEAGATFLKRLDSLLATQSDTRYASPAELTTMMSSGVDLNIKVLDALGTRLVARQSALERDRETMLGLACAMFAIASLLLASTVRSHILAPLKSLTVAIGRVSENDLDVEIPEQERSDELGDIARATQSFQWMARRKVELEHLLANEELQALFDAATAGIVLVKDRAIVRANHGLDRIFGYDAGEQIGRSTRIWFPDDGAYAMSGAISYPAIWRGEIATIEERAVRKDGTPIWVRMSGRAVDPRDRSKGIVSIIEDITDEHEADAALSRVKGELQAILDSASSGIVMTRDHVVIRANRSLHSMFGYEPYQLVGLSTRVWHTDDAGSDRVNRESAGPIGRGETYRAELQLARRDGTRFWARLNAHAVDDRDVSKGEVVVVEDISAEHSMMEEMIRARRIAEDAAQTKADFLANMSHEIRTPMNSIIGMAHLALKTDLTMRQRDYLTKIQNSSHHLLGIINDILDFSKIESGKMTVEKVEFELEHVLAAVADLIGEKAAAKGIELIIDVAEEVPAVLIGDPLRLSQILINYANNAIKFTDHGEITIRIRVVELSETEATLQLSVSDTGIGLSKEQQSRLFKSFEQADRSTTRRYGGSGLGLVISKNLAELMGGTVGVDSEPGVGSTFWVRIRLDIGEGKPWRLVPRPELRGRRVLVVDDSANAREVLGAMLRSMTFHVEALGSGAEAIAEVARARAVGEYYDIIYLDWQMPGMDGVSAAREIRAMALPVPPSIVIVTAYGREELLKAAEGIGVDDVLIKPVTASLLFDVTVRTLSHEEAAVRTMGTASALAARLGTIAGARLLLVEDNDMNQEVARELLSDAGFVVDVAENGAVALERIAATRYDAILMDMQMPVMDGLTATREIRRRPEFEHLPIIAMTANAMANDRANCLAAGMQDHVPKPIDPEDLWRALLTWVPPRPVSGITGEGRAGARSGGEWVGDIPIGVAGLDSDLGLKRSLGKPGLYLSLLRKFLSGQADAAALIKQAVEHQDWETAERLAHTVKGTAGNIGASEVKEHAGRLEAAIKERRPGDQLDRQIDELAEPLTALTSALADVLGCPPETEVAPAVSVDPAELGHAVARLAELLAANDSEATEVLDENAALLRAGFPEDYRNLEDYIRNFDFEEALVVLKAAAAAEPLSP